MTRIWIAGLVLGGIAAAAPAAEHKVRVDHHSGAIDAHYRAGVTIAHRQVGAAGPGGRASTLRCQWSAGVTIDREARHASGTTMLRTISRDDVVEGSRPGWCDGQRRAIAEEVARRTDAVRDHMMAVAAEDHGVLRAEADRLHGTQAAG